LELTLNTDPLLWFNVEKAAGTYEYTAVTKTGQIYQASLTWTEASEANFEATGRFGEHEGATYKEFKMVDSEGNSISLAIGAVKLIAEKGPEETDWVALEPNTDETLWFNIANDTGEYKFLVATSESMVNEAILEWNEPHVPVAKDMSVTTTEDTSKVITLDASDEDDDPLSAMVIQPVHGTVTVNGLDATYTPAANYNGTDSFTFKANDGLLDSTVATVTITITAVNDAPVAEDIEAETDEDTAVAITLLASDVDGDELTFTVVAQPAHGTLSGTAPALTYTPAADFNGTDSFTFKANDGSLDSNIATVTITVGAVNDEPNAVDDEYDAWMGVTLEVPAPGVLANDFDPDPSDEQTVEVKDAPLHGELVLNADGSFTYEPDAGFHGIDTFTYWLISEPGVQSAYMDSATVTITVRPVARIFLPIILK